MGNIFETQNKESRNVRLQRLMFNFFPAYRRTGARIKFISDDWTEVHIQLKLKWSTKNYLGTLFGGSMYGASDPIYVVQLVKILGNEYIVWDKSATIKFIKPVRTRVYAKFSIPPSKIVEIEEEITKNHEMVIEMDAEFVDENQVVHAEVQKCIYIADRKYYLAKRGRSN